MSITFDRLEDMEGEAVKTKCTAVRKASHNNGWKEKPCGNWAQPGKVLCKRHDPDHVPNTYTEHDYERMLQLRKEGVSLRKIADLYGVTVRRIGTVMDDYTRKTGRV